MLQSALQRPLNIHGYGGDDLFALAAAYAVGVIKNDPFLDVNKRTGFMIAALFLEANGLSFQASEEDVVERTLALAASAIAEEDYAAFMRKACGQ